MMFLCALITTTLRLQKLASPTCPRPTLMGYECSFSFSTVCSWFSPLLLLYSTSIIQENKAAWMSANAKLYCTINETFLGHKKIFFSAVGRQRRESMSCNQAFPFFPFSPFPFLFFLFFFAVPIYMIEIHRRETKNMLAVFFVMDMNLLGGFDSKK